MRPSLAAATPIKRQQSCPPTCTKPLRRLSGSQAAREIFGQAFVEHYAATRLWEWRQSQTAVTSWEMERYFEII